MDEKKILQTNITHHCTQKMEDAQSAAAEKIGHILAANQDKSVLFLVSGGSSLAVVDLVTLPDTHKNLEICVVDERFGVPKEDQNYYNLSQTDFAKRFIESGGTVCHGGIDGAENLEVAGDKFDQRLRGALAEDPVIIALLGIGADGHTSGVMPSHDIKDFKTDFIDTKKFAVGYDAGVSVDLPLRVTTTLSFLRDHIDHAIVFAAGIEKDKALKHLLDEKGLINVTPSRVLREMKDVHLYSLCVSC